MNIFSLDTVFDEQLCGAKGFHLSKMKRAGFPIPAGFVLSKQLFEEFFRKNIPLSKEVIEEIKNFLVSLNAQQYMVRSSAIGEDSLGSSFAGQLDSFITSNNIDEIVKNIYRCWKSYDKENVEAYEKSTGKKLHGMGVVIQKLIDPDYAGVIFTRSHLKAEEMLVEYVKGHGENLVSGRVNPESFHASIKTKTFDQILPFDFNIAFNTANALEQFYSYPLDIEWVLKNQTFYVVQARPITTRIKRKLVYWSNTNVNENYPEAITPLLYSIARDSYYHYFKNLSTLFLIPQEKIRLLEASYCNVIGIFGCRMYYNMSSIHEIISESPFSKMLGGSFNNFVGYAEQNKVIAKKNTFSEKLNFTRKFIKLSNSLSKNVIEFEKLSLNYSNKVDAAISFEDFRKCFHGFIEIRMHSWYRASLADFFAMAYHGTLEKFCKKYYMEEASGINNKLIQAIPEIISSKPIIDMYKIKSAIRSKKEVYEKFKSHNSIDFYNWMKSENLASNVNQLIEKYLKNWGFRCSGELMLTAKNYCEDPVAFISLLQQYDALPDVDPEQLIAVKLKERKKIISSFKKKIWTKKGFIFPIALFHHLKLATLIRLTSKGIASRERVRLKQALLYFKFKQVVARIGEEFVKQGILKNSEDIFFMRYQEIAENLSASDMLSGNICERTVERKKEFDANKKHIYPDDFYNETGIYSLPENVSDQTIALSENAGTLKGLSACGGKIKGRAKVLLSVMEASKLEKGDILITRQTDPGWVVVFPLISGLVVERGGMLSHGAIVSREFGIPAIVGVHKATEKIKDNDIIFLNADNGEITFGDK